MGMTVFAHFTATTTYFGEGPQQSMLNFRIDDRDALLQQLAEAGVRIDPKREDASYGRFPVSGARKAIAWSCGSRWWAEVGLWTAA